MQIPGGSESLHLYLQGCCSTLIAPKPYAIPKRRISSKFWRAPQNLHNQDSSSTAQAPSSFSFPGSPTGRGEGRRGSLRVPPRKLIAHLGDRASSSGKKVPAFQVQVGKLRPHQRKNVFLATSTGYRREEIKISSSEIKIEVFCFAVLAVEPRISHNGLPNGRQVLYH
jgi:hypothetical protein